MNVFRIIVTGMAILLASAASAGATLFLEWDVANSGAWDNTARTLANTSGFTPKAGQESFIKLDPIRFFGGVQYVNNGADRPYIDFVSDGYATSTNQYTIFNPSTGAFVTNIGRTADRGVGDDTPYCYTMSMYLYAPTSITAKENAGIGSKQDGKNQNEFLFIGKGGTTLQSWNGMRKPTAAESWTFAPAANIHPHVDRTQWFLFTKVFDYDAVLGTATVSYYVDGLPIGISTVFSPGPDYFFSGEHGGSDWIGAIGGEASRAVTGLGFSYFAVYGGAMTAMEVKNSYYAFMADTSWKVPEPATMSLLALGGLALLRRRK